MRFLSLYLLAYLLLPVALHAAEPAAAVACEPGYARLEQIGPRQPSTPFEKFFHTHELNKKLSAGREQTLKELFQQGRVPGELTEAKLLEAVLNASTAAGDEDDAFRFILTTLAKPQEYRGLNANEAIAVWPRVKDAQSPYSLGFDLAAKSDKEPFHAMKELIDFEKILAGPSNEKANWLDAWITSPAHALYAYDALAGMRPLPAGILQALFERNEYFKRVGRVRGPPAALVTLSYEKETFNKNITMLYRDANMTDEQWMKLTEEERLERLRKIVGDRKTHAISHTEIAPTGLLNRASGGLRNDPGFSRTWVWEFTHKKYEIDPAQLSKEMREVSALLKENDFHVHLAFELPRNYQFMNEYNHWVKQANDYLYLRGLEDHGIHGNHLTGVAPVPMNPLLRPEPPKPGRLRAFMNRLLRRDASPQTRRLERDSEWPSHLEDIAGSTYKYRTAGMRGRMYGQASNPDYIRVGIELRDATRNMDTWEQLVQKFHKSLSQKPWERTGAWIENDVMLTKSKTLSRREAQLLTEAGIDQEIIGLFADAEPTLSIALKDFDTAKVRDYTNGSFRTASPEQAEKLRAARQQFIESLKKLQEEVKGIRQRGEPLETEDLQGAIRMTMSEWARDARPSTLFEGL